ncbi:perlucin-like protein [Branchiostoma floridae x Branchiostoma belcheri]
MSTSLIYMLLVLFAVECTGQPAVGCHGSADKWVCSPVANVGHGQLADIQAMLIAQQVQIMRLQKDSESCTCDSEVSRLSDLLAEQRNITENLKERVTQLEEITEPFSCPAGYQKFNRACYRFSTDQKPYSEARDTCHREGGILATAKDEETHNFLANHVRATTQGNTWIGLTDLATDGLWVWDDGTSLLGEGIWGTGPDEPNGGTWENCAHIYPSKDYRWNDSTCPSSYYYICEIRG